MNSTFESIATAPSTTYGRHAEGGGRRNAMSPVGPGASATRIARSPEGAPPSDIETTDDVQRHRELLVIDGTNVCFWHGQAGEHRNTSQAGVSMRPLLVLLTQILEHGDDFYCIFDATTVHHIYRHGNRKEARMVDGFVRNFPRHFFVVTGGSTADSAIAHFADRHNCRIVTNDRRYGMRLGDQFPWLQSRSSPRLIRGNCQRQGLITLERLAYGFMEVPSVPTGELLDRLLADLAMSGKASSTPHAIVSTDRLEVPRMTMPQGGISPARLTPTPNRTPNGARPAAFAGQGIGLSTNVPHVIAPNDPAIGTKSIEKSRALRIPMPPRLATALAKCGWLSRLID